MSSPVSRRRTAIGVIVRAVAVLLLAATCPAAATGDDSLPDNPGLRLPYAESDAHRIRIDEGMHYRTPRDFSNRQTPPTYRQFREECGSNEECVRHFPDADRVNAAHKSIDYLDVTGGTFTVYAGVKGVVYRINRVKAEPWYSSVIVKARVRGRFYFIEYSHLDPDSIQLVESQPVTVTTPIGHTYADQDAIWDMDGVTIRGYCRPSGQTHPFPDHPGRRCYPSHLDYQVREIIGESAEAKDPYGICAILTEGNSDSCKGYHYPGNRFGTPPRQLGAQHLWDLANASPAIRAAIGPPFDEGSTAAP